MELGRVKEEKMLTYDNTWILYLYFDCMCVVQGRLMRATILRTRLLDRRLVFFFSSSGGMDSDAYVTRPMYVYYLVSLKYIEIKGTFKVNLAD